MTTLIDILGTSNKSLSIYFTGIGIHLKEIGKKINTFFLFSMLLYNIFFKCFLYWTNIFSDKKGDRVSGKKILVINDMNMIEIWLPSLGWYDKSGTNICYVGYEYAKKKTSEIKLIPHLIKMIKTKRVQFVAKTTCDLVMDVRKVWQLADYKNLDDFSQMVSVGFSLGVYIAAYFGRCLSHRTGHKIGKLIGNYQYTFYREMN